MDKWDRRFLEQAKLVSTYSKDPSTRVGSVIVDPRRVPVSSGYNGFPRGIEDSVERLNDRETKYTYTIHAETNAVYNAAWNGTSPYGGTIYVWGLPICHECTKAVIQSGISRVVIMHPRDVSPVWEERWNTSRSMLEEVGTWYSRYYDDETLVEDHRGGDEPIEPR